MECILSGYCGWCRGTVSSHKMSHNRAIYIQVATRKYSPMTKIVFSHVRQRIEPEPSKLVFKVSQHSPSRAGGIAIAQELDWHPTEIRSHDQNCISAPVPPPRKFTFAELDFPMVGAFGRSAVKIRMGLGDQISYDQNPPRSP